VERPRLIVTPNVVMRELGQLFVKVMGIKTL
jgi:hypothetical protein